MIKRSALISVVPSSKKRWWKFSYSGTILRLPGGEITCDDALTFLNALRDACTDIVFLDPPFNLGKKYGNQAPRQDRISDEDYLKYMTAVLWRSCAILKPGGSLFLYHIPRWAIRFAEILNAELNFRHWIAISMKNGSTRARHLVPAHYALLYYSKNEPKHFRVPRIPIARCRKCGQTLKDYGGYKRFVEKGLNLSDFWEDISPVRHSRYKHRQANELPLKLVARILQISGVKGGILVDPFAGTGTSLLAAQSAGMTFIGNDKEKSCLSVMGKRLTAS
jgi:site-specific DNA-methyltransferase (adenine-specific)